MVKQLALAAMFLLGTMFMAPGEALAKGEKAAGKNEHKNDHKGKGNDDGKKKDAGEHFFKPEILQKILRDNPGLTPKFLTESLPDTPIKLSNGKTYPLYQLDQFLQANFRIQWYARKKEGEAIVAESSRRLRKLMALPDFHDRVMHHKQEYIISPKGKVSAQEAYNHFRRCTARLGATAGKQYHAPVGGGGGIAAPSWAVWKAINLFEHETCHCIGIGHNSGGLSGAIAGTLRDWDRKDKWNYPTIDANTLVITPAVKVAPEGGKNKKGHDGKGKQKGGKATPGTKGNAANADNVDNADNADNDENMDDMDDNKDLDAGPEDDVVDAEALATDEK
jgi:hypothetical protein